MDKTYNNKVIGTIGEDMAEVFLANKGYRVLIRNFRCRFGEIDIIAKKDGIIFFIEVKTRFSQQYGSGRESVNAEKIEHIKKCAEYYTAKVNWTGDIAFHVIEICLNHIINPI